MPPMVWNTANNEKMLLFLLASNPGIKLDFEGCAKMLSDKFQQCTARAVQERFKKIKSDVMKDPKWVNTAEMAARGHARSLKGRSTDLRKEKKRQVRQSKSTAKNTAHGAKSQKAPEDVDMEQAEDGADEEE